MKHDTRVLFRNVCATFRKEANLLVQHWAKEVALGNTQVQPPKDGIDPNAFQVFVDVGIIIKVSEQYVMNPGAWKCLKEINRDQVRAARSSVSSDSVPVSGTRRRKSRDREATREISPPYLEHLKGKMAVAS